MCPFVSVFSAIHLPSRLYSRPLLPSRLLPVASSFRVIGPLSSNELFIIHLPLEHCESFVGGVCVLLHPLIPVPSTDPDTGVTEAEEPNPVSTLPPLPTLAHGLVGESFVTGSSGRSPRRLQGQRRP